MLDLKAAATLARVRINERLSAAAKNEKNALPLSATVIQQGSSFRAHLIDALRRGGDERTSPSPAPDALFLAFPEKLLGKWHHLAYGTQRQSKEPTPTPSRDIDAWRTWDAMGSKTRITNFIATQPKAILLAHGLAAIEDSVLLLADIGRCSRAARSINVPLRVLLADVSWISYNRSLRRFDLTDQQIESGLRSCQASRQRLYEAVGAEPKVHAIVPYQKKGAISAQKIQMIAAHYLQLASNLWGSDKINTLTPLTNTDAAVIGRQLQNSLGSDSPLQFLASFPGALPALESALGHHLSVIRTIAQRFRVLSSDTFSYYFAQYYAQDEYRGTHVKVAPESERDFDEPYDELDSSFRLWGDGHEPTVTTKRGPHPRKRRMAAVYLPQYSIGDWDLLPYSPLSLGAVANSGGTVANVRDKVILLSDCNKDDKPKVETLLRATRDRSGVIQLNRLIADLLSFMQAVLIARGRGAVEAACRRIDGDLDASLAVLHPQLVKCLSIECEPKVATNELWLSWLDAIDRDSSLDYVPCHLLLTSLSYDDWTDERFGAAAELVLTATRLARDLSQ
ncbi:MAG: hypothetical protein IPK44_04645 [Candidatus Accumulibacter sp.]|jgi:hypothetical protein|uniref:hypothetical protein n=1 Tax=Accumulibacter sp. TaxID=2053492 RepID=UPI00258EE866|nr:hypothetical protein [Accumulibacter sp.]MBK8113876.1 hypothetical protein [Accumulibacter sp.]